MVLIMAYGESSILFLIFTLLTIRHISYIFKITHTCIFMVLLVVLLWKNALKKKNSFSWYPNTSKKLKVIWIYFFDPYSPLLMEDVHMTPYLEPLCTVRNSICSRHSDIRIAVVFPCSMATATTTTTMTMTSPTLATNWQDRFFKTNAWPSAKVIGPTVSNGLYSFFEWVIMIIFRVEFYWPLTWYHWHANIMTQNSIVSNDVLS